jgi:hypothetical protein
VLTPTIHLGRVRAIERGLFFMNTLNYTAIHSFWSKPMPQDPSGKIPLDAVQALTWVASAVNGSRLFGNLVMMTDDRGLQFMRANGLDAFYSCVHTPLNLLQDLPDAFWAAGKLAALSSVPAPCLSIDLDAVIWRMPEAMVRATYDVAWGHDEGNDAECYKENRETLGILLPQILQKDHLWELPVANTCLMAFDRRDIKDYYTTTALKWMRNFQDSKLFEYEKMRAHSMVFAEQRLLPMCAKLMGMRTASFGTLKHPVGGDQDHLVKNRAFTHLWSSKSLYDSYWPAMARYCRWMINWLRKRGKDIDFVRRIEAQLDQYEYSAEGRKLIDEQMNAMKQRYSQVRNVEGALLIWEPNLPEPIALHDGDLWLPWESILYSKNNRFELWMNDEKKSEWEGGKFK